VIGRVSALHRAHALVVQKVVDTDTDTLASLLNRLVAPYREDAADRVIIVGDDVVIGKSAATAIALVVHELATNAVKYGALSEQTGQVRISVRCDAEHASLKWEEDGGPNIEIAPRQQGFGSLLIERATKSQLGGSLHFDWKPAGVAVTIVMSPERLLA
jgi:two-component sensor histidine kinase